MRALTGHTIGALALVVLFLASASWAQEGEDSQPASDAAAPTTTAGQTGAADDEAEATVQGTQTPAVEPAASETPPSEPATEETPSALERAVTVVPDGVAEVTERGNQAWRDYVYPLWLRFVEALPSVIRPFVLLLLFWIVAILAGWSVTKVLSLTRLDERAAKDLGLEKAVTRWEEQGTSLAKMAGRAAKWIILLFGVVAFFDAINLTLVAGPLQNILSKIAEAVPAVLMAAAILLLYWIIGALLRFAVTRTLSAMRFDERAGRYLKPREVDGEVVGPSAMVGRLVFYVVLLFGLPPFLEALGQEAAVAPLREMMSKIFNFLPNVVAAGILLLVGRIVATIVREVVANFLAAAGTDTLLERFHVDGGEDSRKLSEIVGSVAFFLVFISIAVAAIDSLQIEAIAEPVKNTLERLLAAVPLIFVAGLVISVGYLVAKAVQSVLSGFLRGIGFDTLPEKVGLDFLIPKEGSMTLSAITGNVVMVVIMLLMSQQALATLQLTQLSEPLGTLLGYLPDLLVGVLIMLLAMSLGKYVSRLIETLGGDTAESQFLSRMARYAIFFLGFSMGLNQIGVAREIIIIVVGAVLGGAALAFGISFGLGGQDRAKDLLGAGSSFKFTGWPGDQSES